MLAYCSKIAITHILLIARGQMQAVSDTPAYKGINPWLVLGHPGLKFSEKRGKAYALSQGRLKVKSRPRGGH